MSNIRKFPGRGPSKTGQGARDTGFQVVGLDGKPVDVLVQIVHAGGVFLIPMQEGASEEPPTAQLLRTISSFDAFTDGANALIAYVRNHLVALDTAESLVQFGIGAQKVMRRLYESAPSDQIILALESYGPEFHVEYVTTAAMTVACGYALKILDLYGRLFIETGKDKRKVMFTDFQAGYREAQAECDSVLKDQESIIKELTAANRALQKLLKDV